LAEAAANAIASAWRKRLEEAGYQLYEVGL